MQLRKTLGKHSKNKIEIHLQTLVMELCLKELETWIPAHDQISRALVLEAMELGHLNL